MFHELTHNVSNGLGQALARGVEKRIFQGYMDRPSNGILSQDRRIEYDRGVLETKLEQDRTFKIVIALGGFASGLAFGYLLASWSMKGRP